MLLDVSKGQYTTIPVSSSSHYQGWCQFIPASEEETRVTIQQILPTYDPLNASVRIASVNSALNGLGLADKRVNFLSSEKEWVEAYWSLYSKCLICFGYRREDRNIKQMFARPLKNALLA